MFQLFADGDLYYVKIDYKKMSFNEFKNNVITTKENASGLAFFEKYGTRSYIKCTPVDKK
jgi:hypothetical protein